MKEGRQSRWTDVPLYMEEGKRSLSDDSRIYITHIHTGPLTISLHAPVHVLREREREWGGGRWGRDLVSYSCAARMVSLISKRFSDQSTIG